MNEKILIAGYGYLGKYLANELVKNNNTVNVIKRSHIDTENGINFIFKDINSIQANDIPDIDYIFYLLAPNSFNEQEYLKTYVNGLTRLCKALKNQHIKRLIFISSTSVYEQNDTSIVDENSAAEPNNFPGKTMLAAEKVLKESKINYIIARLSGIYGPHRPGINISRPDEFFSNRIHVHDACNALIHLMKLKDPYDIYITTDCAPSKYKDIKNWLHQNQIIPNQKPTKRALTNKRLSNKRLLESGFSFTYPSYKEGLKSIITQAK
jgi:nucleoside-diphosphate-sugar epimerase